MRSYPALPTIEYLKKPEIQTAIVKAVEEKHQPVQLELEGVSEKPDIATVVAKTVELVTRSVSGTRRLCYTILVQSCHRAKVISWPI